MRYCIMTILCQHLSRHPQRDRHWHLHERDAGQDDRKSSTHLGFHSVPEHARAAPQCSVQRL